MKSWILFCLLVSLFSEAAFSATDEDESFMTYDEIVDELNQSRVQTPLKKPRDIFETVKIHFGMGVVNSYLNLDSSSGREGGALEGAEINFGIDLFDPEWLAEGSMRTFNSQRLSSSSGRATLREFDLKLVYRPALSRHLRLRTGGGLASRYLTLKNEAGIQEYTTPAFAALLGIEAKLTRVLSLGAELGYRSKIIEETIDNSAIEGMIKADFQF